MGIVAAIQSAVHQQIRTLYQTDFPASSVLVNETKPEFEGDYTVVLFALVSAIEEKPGSPRTGARRPAGLQPIRNCSAAFNVIKGFLNLTIAEA